MRLITEVVCNLKANHNLHLPPALDNKTLEALKFVCTDTEVAEFVWVLDKQGGCAYRIGVFTMQICRIPPLGKSWH